VQHQSRRRSTNARRRAAAAGLSCWYKPEQRRRWLVPRMSSTGGGAGKRSAADRRQSSRRFPVAPHGLAVLRVGEDPASGFYRGQQGKGLSAGGNSQPRRPSAPWNHHADQGAGRDPTLNEDHRGGNRHPAAASRFRPGCPRRACWRRLIRRKGTPDGSTSLNLVVYSRGSRSSQFGTRSRVNGPAACGAPASALEGARAVVVGAASWWASDGLMLPGWPMHAWTVAIPCRPRSGRTHARGRGGWWWPPDSRCWLGAEQSEAGAAVVGCGNPRLAPDPSGRPGGPRAAFLAVTCALAEVEPIAAAITPACPCVRPE